ncbi:putative RNA-binding domain superfamily [Helianthus debilis subsp. tardiflorus]
MGNRFGFVSFQSVRDWKELEKSLNGVNMGGFKLIVNIARFAVENSRVVRDQVKPKASGGQGGGSYQQGDVCFAANRDGRSFRDVVKPKPSGAGPSGGVLNGVPGSSEKSVVVSDRVRAFGELHGKAVVGRTVDLDTLVFFDRLLRIGNVSYVRLQYMGGLSLMVSFGSSEEAEAFLSKKDLWGPWFSSLDLWVGQVLAVERIGWIRIQGILVHLFGLEVFRMIRELFGKTVYVPPDVEEETDLSGKSVGILAGNESRVKEFVSLRWKDKVFCVWVSEDDSEWLPDCIRDLDPEVLSPEKEAPEMVNSGRGGEEMEVEGGDVSGSKVMGENSNSQCPINSDPGLNSMSATVSSCHYFGSGDKGEAAGINKVINCKKGGTRSFNRRKAKCGPASMGSPVESRPKKRARAQVEKDDLFGLDELIQKGPFSFQNNVNLNDTGIGQTGIDGDLEASLDLNRSSNSQSDHLAA